ncbi:MAG: Unknown protein [uncultured Thiotrichaceae bacterium]|uniref:Uncharacterized protein n=1 Tax=uncultured Thiotrichaceae bacterium TaxID=298394 RepID=A0A6S6SVL7_9GAMM|nr:MAG: Unknown protein [uncultured Thiotrichaceae bacterium]
MSIIADLQARQLTTCSTETLLEQLHTSGYYLSATVIKQALKMTGNAFGKVCYGFKEIIDT